jgi:hypothetical protein
VSTAAFFAARRLIDGLAELARPGLPLDGVQVSYGWPGGIQQRCIYLGELPFRQEKGPTAGAADTLVQETGTITLYVRVMQPLVGVPDGGDAVRVADSAAEQIVDAVGDYVRAKSSSLLGPNTDLFPSGGRRDYANTDDEVIVSVRFDLTFTCFIGGA